ncbi:MAG: hypothetical protein RL701_2321 [Pseudomonadota bacterium]
MGCLRRDRPLLVLRLRLLGRGVWGLILSMMSLRTSIASQPQRLSAIADEHRRARLSSPNKDPLVEETWEASVGSSAASVSRRTRSAPDSSHDG